LHYVSIAYTWLAEAQGTKTLNLIIDPWFYAIAVPAVLVSAIGKGGFAGATSNVMVPVMALLIPVPQAAGIALILLCAMDLTGLRAWWGKWDKREMRLLLPASMVGVAVGAALFGLLTPRTVQGLLGIITLLFLAYRLVQGMVAAAPPSPYNPVKGAICAIAAGATSTLAHAGGPPMQIYLLPRRLPREVFSATNVVLFGLINYAKLVPYGWMGLLDLTNLGTALVLLPLCPVGVYLGIWLQRRIPEALFYRIITAALLVLGLKLTWDGFFA
jgi:uncharacterized membrane protein YfcA